MIDGVVGLELYSSGVNALMLFCRRGGREGGENNRLMELEGVLNSENKCLPLPVGSLETILGTWPTKLLQDGSPLPSPEAAGQGQALGTSERGAFCPGSNPCLQNNNLLSAHQAQ